LSRVANESLRNLPETGEVRKKILIDAVEFLEGFLKERPHDFELRYEAASTFLRMIENFGGLGLVTERQQVLDRAYELLRELHAEQPDHLGIRMNLALTHSHYSYVGFAGALDRPQDQESAIRRAIELLTPIVDDLSVNEKIRSWYRYRLAHAYSGLGPKLQTLNRLAEAEQAYKSAIGLLLHERDGSRQEVLKVTLGELKDSGPLVPGSPEGTLGKAYHGLAGVLDRLGRTPEAIDAMQETIRWMNVAREINPSDTDLRIRFAEQCTTFGNLLVRSDRTDEALAYFRTAFPILTQLLHDFPSESSNYRNLIRNQSVTLIQAYRKLGKTDDVRQYLAQLGPRTAGDYALRARLYQNLEDWPAARADCEQALEIEPGNVSAREQLPRIKSKQEAAQKKKP
jgi:tetratricopeptide (TPR) repeat protein